MVFLQWEVEPVNLQMSHLSTDYVPIPVSVTSSGAPYNPTSRHCPFRLHAHPYTGAPERGLGSREPGKRSARTSCTRTTRCAWWVPQGRRH